MEAIQKKNLDYGYLIKLGIGLGFMLFFRYIPPMSPITPVGMQVIGIFIGTIFLIATIHPAWPAFIAAFLLATTPLYSANEVIAQTMGNWLPSFLICIFMMGYALIQSGIAKRLTTWMITRPILKGRPWLFTTTFLLSLLFVGSLMEGMGLIAFYLASVALICEQLGYKKRDKYPTGLVIGVGFMTALAGATTVFQSHVAFVMGQYTTASGLTIDVFKYTIWALVPSIILFAIFMLLFRFVLKPDMSNFDTLDFETLKITTPVTKKEKLIGVIYLCVVFMWMVPGILEMAGLSATAFGIFFAKLGIVMPAYFGVIVMSIVRVEGQPLLNFTKAAKEGVQWNIVFLVAGNMILGNALQHADVGFTQWFEITIKPLVANASPFMFIFLICLATIIFTNLGSNSVAAIIGFQLASLLLPEGMSLAVMAVLIAFSCRAAFMLPSSFVGIATIYGDEWCDTKKILPYGTAMAIISTFVLAFIGSAFATFLF